MLFEEINPLLDRIGVSPMDAMQQLFKEFRNILNKYEGKSVREVDSEYKKYWIMFIDMCKEKGVKRNDVKDFLNHYVDQRKSNHITPSLVEDEGFRKAANEIVMKFTKDLNSGSDFD